jgi:antagonist of KipI
MIQVVEGGQFTTVQDLGRPGWQAQGVPVGGAVDALALRLANLVVGNPEGAPALECSLSGPVLRFEEEAWIGVAGAAVRGLEPLRPLRFGPGDLLDLRDLSEGARTYLAVAGGLDVPLVLGSASTHVPSGLGGLGGRALRSGDRLGVRPGGRRPRSVGARWWVLPTLGREGPGRGVIRCLPGPQAELFGPDALLAWTQSSFRVTDRWDRMGLRLAGPELPRRDSRELVSEGVTEGTVQVPPDGRPIVLLADRQTLGGYAKLATIISVDLPAVAQARPGDRLHFVPVTLPVAQDLLVRRENALAALKVGLETRFDAPAHA